MNFAVILAGGTGTRMQNGSLPKQFIKLCSKPIIIHTLERILSVKEFDYVIIAIHPSYKEYLEDMLKEYGHVDSNIIITFGGKERIDSIQNSLDAIIKISQNVNDTVVFHDAVRPFVSREILINSINTVKEHDACVAVVPAVDTMYVLDENGTIAATPDRKTIFHGQAPDSFKVKVIKSALDSLTKEERKNITGTVQICAYKGYKINTIKGDAKNIKITMLNDLEIAEHLIKEEEANESICLNR